MGSQGGICHSISVAFCYLSFVIFNPLANFASACYRRGCRKSSRDEFWNIFRGHFTLPDLKIVDSGPFYEVDLYSWNKKVTLWDFFDSLGWSGVFCKENPENRKSSALLSLELGPVGFLGSLAEPLSVIYCIALPLTRLQATWANALIRTVASYLTSDAS